MKRAILWITALLAVLMLTSCPQPFDLTTGQLKGETFTYTSNGYIGDPEDGITANYVTTYVFDSTGEAGTYEVSISTYGYPTAAAEASGDYTQQAWFRTGGERGTFTYDPETYIRTTSVTDYWDLIDDPVAHYQADYAYRSLASSYGTECTAASISNSSMVVFNQDHIIGVSVAEGDAYASTSTYNRSTTIAGVTSTYSNTDTYTYTINGTTFTVVNDYASTSNDGTTTSTGTYRSTSTYNVTQFFAVGSTKEGETFESVWKNGKSVSFGLSRTRYETLSYSGTTAPTVDFPDVDPETGSVSVTTPTYSYSLNVVPGEPFMQTFTKQKDYIASSSSFSSASRDLD